MDDLGALAKQLGIRLDAKAAALLTDALAKANAKRRTLVLGYEDLLRAAQEAVASPHGIAVRHGGAEVLKRTSLCLAVKAKQGVVVGVGQCVADRPTPGQVWRELGPWQQDFARNVEKASAWATKRASDRATVAVSGKPAKPKRGKGPSPAAMFAEILEHPDDDAPRLVYADYLTEQSDPRGEFIAVQCALSNKTGSRRALLARERELLKKHRRTWSKEALQVALDCELRRGFVASIKATANAFAKHGARLFAHDPIEELVLSKPTATGLAELAAAPHLAKLRTLRASSPLWLGSAKDIDKLRTFLRSKYLRVRSLAIHINYSVEADDMFADVRVPSVEKLVFGLMGPGSAALKKQLARAFPNA